MMKITFGGKLIHRPFRPHNSRSRFIALWAMLVSFRSFGTLLKEQAVSVFNCVAVGVTIRDNCQLYDND
jgi:hypothetical protein